MKLLKICNSRFTDRFFVIFEIGPEFGKISMVGDVEEYTITKGEDLEKLTKLIDDSDKTARQTQTASEEDLCYRPNLLVVTHILAEIIKRKQNVLSTAFDNPVSGASAQENELITVFNLIELYGEERFIKEITSN